MTPHLRMIVLAVACLALGQSAHAQSEFNPVTPPDLGQADRATPLDTNTIIAGLRTVDPDQVAFIVYVQALRQQGRLSSFLIDSSYDYGKRKANPRRFMYFRQSLTLRAATQGITLPQGTPSLVGTIQGTTFIKVGPLNIPVIGATVVIDGTNFSTISDSLGRFQFTNVPFGVATVKATKGALLSGSVSTTLPSPPPSTTPVVIGIQMN